jgi:hypothetical protein
MALPGVELRRAACPPARGAGPRRRGPSRRALLRQLRKGAGIDCRRAGRDRDHRRSRFGRAGCGYLRHDRRPELQHVGWDDHVFEPERLELHHWHREQGVSTHRSLFEQSRTAAPRPRTLWQQAEERPDEHNGAVHSHGSHRGRVVHRRRVQGGHDRHPVDMGVAPVARARSEAHRRGDCRGPRLPRVPGRVLAVAVARRRDARHDRRCRQRVLQRARAVSAPWRRRGWPRCHHRRVHRDPRPQHRCRARWAARLPDRRRGRAPQLEAGVASLVARRESLRADQWCFGRDQPARPQSRRRRAHHRRLRRRTGACDRGRVLPATSPDPSALFDGDPTHAPQSPHQSNARPSWRARRPCTAPQSPGER